MKIPKEPLNLFPCPVADDGTYKIPPAEKDASGRASLKLGFPEETQLPLNQGGVAPNRMDFNGLFHMLSSFAFWQQSGGQWSFDEGLNYKQPNLVFHQGLLWWCLKDNGISTEAGIKTPGKNPEYWQDFLSFVLHTGKELGISIGSDLGDIKMHYGTTAPEGWFPCTDYEFSASKYPALYERLGKNRTPDMRGLVVRGYDPEGVNDPDGKSRNFGTLQQDTIQNIKGDFGTTILYDQKTGNGAFYVKRYGTNGRGSDTGTYTVYLDTSRVVRTSNETRMKNINLLYCIKHD